MAPIDLIERKSEKLADEGYRPVNEGNASAALAIAAELEALHYTGAFEIAALAQAQLGKLEVAVATLERGLESALEVWINWQLLGNYRSDRVATMRPR